MAECNMSAEVACSHRRQSTITDNKYQQYKNSFKNHNSMEFTDNHVGVDQPLSTPKSRYEEKYSIPDSESKDVLQSEFDIKFLAFREKIVKNWIFVKENSNPFSWWKQLKTRIFCQSDFDDADIDSMCLERRDLAELLVIEALQKTACKTVGDIEFLESIVLRNIEKYLQQKKKISINASADINLDTDSILTNHLKEWEKCLNRQDVIKIKDHLLQEAIITFEENEELVKDKDYYNRNKTHLFSEVVRKVQANTSKGSLQCFIQHAENIIEHKQCGKKLIQIIKGQPYERTQPAKKSSLITRENSREYDKRKGPQGFMNLKLERKENGKEVAELCPQFEDNVDVINKVLVEKLGAECTRICNGSVMIYFQSLDKDMCCSLDCCFADLIPMLLKAVDLERRIPIGEYTLKAKVSLTHNNDNHSGNKTNFDFLPLTDNISFLAAEKSFLEEEMDIDAVLDGLIEGRKNIASIDRCQDHKHVANKLLEAMIENNLEEDFISILREYRMTYVLKRYETFLKVYSAGTVIIRRNIIRQFSNIIQNIQIEDLQEVLIGLQTIDETALNEILIKCGDRSDVAMATLILKCLTSGNDIHAFAYALVLQKHIQLEEIILPYRHQTDESYNSHEICPNTEGTSLLFEGCFNIIIRDAETEKSIEYVSDKPSRDSGMGISTGIPCISESQSASTHMDDCGDRSRYSVVASVFLEIVKPNIKLRLKTYYQRKGFMCLHDFIECRTTKHILFHLRHRNSSCCDDINNCSNRDELSLTYGQWDILYTENQGENVHNCYCNFTGNDVRIEEIDLILASLVLLNCCELTQEEKNPISNLQTFYDNYLGYNVNKLITETEYNSFWEDLTANVVELDPSKKMDMVRLNNRILDEPMHEEYVGILRDIENKHKRKAESSIQLLADSKRQHLNC